MIPPKTYTNTTHTSVADRVSISGAVLPQSEFHHRFNDLVNTLDENNYAVSWKRNAGAYTGRATQTESENVIMIILNYEAADSLSTTPPFQATTFSVNYKGTVAGEDIIQQLLDKAVEVYSRESEEE